MVILHAVTRITPSREFLIKRALIVVALIALMLLVYPVSRSAGQTRGTPDYGDAPDSNNGLEQAMEAYPGTNARFPTATAGPFHHNVELAYHLGRGISGEDGAVSGHDADGFNNLDPANNSADHDAFDDGLRLPEALPHCQEVELTFQVTVIVTTSVTASYLNVWMDWNRNGTWAEEVLPECPDGSPVGEWAVANHPLGSLGPGMHTITVPVMVWNPDPEREMWLRVSLSDGETPHSDGRGPDGGYRLGETEDYLLPPLPERIPVVTPSLPDPVSFDELVSPPPPGPYRIDLPVVVKHGSSGEEGLPGGRLHEVDAAHIGGTGSPVTPLVATAAGTGYAVRLSSWTLPHSLDAAPQHLQDSATLPGYDVKLETLIEWRFDYNLLVSAQLRDGDLWLTSWRIGGDGVFHKLDTKGYGRNAGVRIRAYDITHRRILRESMLHRFQVVTPILSETDEPRFITWSVHPDTGLISGQYDSGDWGGEPGPTTQLSVAFIEGDSWTGPYYVVGYRNSRSNLESYFWKVGNNHLPVYGGHGASGVDIRGTDPVEQLTRHVAVHALSPTGFLSVVEPADITELRLVSWDNQRACFGDTGCFVQPHYISDQTVDIDPDFGVTIEAPDINADRALVFDANYENTLYEKNSGNSGPQGIASVTKVMTLIVTLQALADGEVSLDDDVEISALAAGVGGSGIGLEENEIQTLRTLLWGLMVDSGNDAALAIAEYVGGSVENFITRANDVAAGLEMDDSTYCQPAGGCFSTPADQVALWHSVWQDPLFQTFAGPANYMGCGTDAEGEEKCYFFDKSTNAYPGYESGKGGSKGFFCSAEDYPETEGLPLCASGGCLSAQATRLSRTLILNELQPQPLTASRWPDARNLWDFGYRQLFTPDFLGDSGSAAGSTPDFGLDYITDARAITAGLAGDNTVELCNWTAVTWTGQLVRHACAEQTVNDLPAGVIEPPPTHVAVVRPSTLEAEGDYLVGHRVDDDLVLSIWRIGPYE